MSRHRPFEYGGQANTGTLQWSYSLGRASEYQRYLPMGYPYVKKDAYIRMDQAVRKGFKDAG